MLEIALILGMVFALVFVMAYAISYGVARVMHRANQFTADDARQRMIRSAELECFAAADCGLSSTTIDLNDVDEKIVHAVQVRLLSLGYKVSLSAKPETVGSYVLAVSWGMA